MPEARLSRQGLSFTSQRHRMTSKRAAASIATRLIVVDEKSKPSPPAAGQLVRMPPPRQGRPGSRQRGRLLSTSGKHDRNRRNSLRMLAAAPLLLAGAASNTIGQKPPPAQTARASHWCSAVGRRAASHIGVIKALEAARQA